MWTVINNDDLKVGMNIRIRPQIQVASAPLYTPRWANGLMADIVRINKRSVTVDVYDGLKYIYIDKMDCGLNEN